MPHLNSRLTKLESGQPGRLVILIFKWGESVERTYIEHQGEQYFRDPGERFDDFQERVDALIEKQHTNLAQPAIAQMWMDKETQQERRC